MSHTVFNNHPLIKNTNQYFLEKKYISINSDDRDITKYPNSSDFEILLPQEYLNVASARLYSWSFPANYNVFSPTYFNVIIAFKFGNLYNPGEHSFSDILTEGIFAALYNHGDKEIFSEIEPGFYNPDQMATELTNKFNSATSRIIYTFFETPSEWGGYDYTAAKNLFINSEGYNRFKIVYNSVSQKLWFGNNADQFVLTNTSEAYISELLVNNNCLRKNQLPSWANWGLPAYLGFSRCDSSSYTAAQYLADFPGQGPVFTSLKQDSGIVPRFFYGDAISGSGDAGFWLLPTLPGAEVYFLQAPFKISFMGPAYIYMEIDGWNCIDETSPYNLSLYTATNNQTNGVVNSSFAKIPVPTTPISQWFDNDMGPYKYWNPPAERISKIKVKFRYHNGVPVEFGQFEYSFMLELNILKPQQEKSYSIVNAFDLGQQQSYASKFI
jgi:hypothetical protein